MIGQHPQAYGLPELNLFIADTVNELLRLHAPRPRAIHGLLRTIAELEYGGQTDETVAAARAWLEERSDLTTHQLFDLIIDGVAPRMAVDKSPSTTLRPEYLERAYAMFPGANFLHLTRHPRTTGESIVKQLRQGDARGAPRSDQLDPQAAWMRAHTNIVNFAVTLPEGQCLRIKAEDLLSEPKLYLPQIAEWLGLDTSAATIEAMMHPERSPYAAPGPEAARFGNDAEFLERPAYRRERVTEPALLGRLSWAPDADFDKPTLKLARELGYA